ncbi:cytochrome c family protein [Hyphomicrobium sp. ghe19]|uniref:cytochrome c family protein n=1 Tax=Hyphomicrobium sp. ghe19 TaxID=2682968 RepID=UPI0013669AFE|nr:Perchlorate reductase subunit gamma [Hyphomicrobium sp. ghe19]
MVSDRLSFSPSHFGTRRLSRLACFLSGSLIMFFVACGAAASDPAQVVGPNACAECHKQETEAWKTTHHFKTFRDLPRNAEAKKIADKMGVRRIKSEGLCVTCHFTVQQKDDGKEPVAGISCESCHSAGKDWIKVHSGYSGKTAKTETKAEAAARWKLANSKGMIGTSAIYQLAKNCYGCHVVPQEELVNKGGHRAGSAFDLVSWSQGEVRHNTWYSKGKDNAAANATRKRMLYLIGLGVELETSLRAVAKATVRKPYAFFMAERVDRVRKQLAAAAKAAPNVPEIAKLIEYAHSASLKLNNERLLTAAADSVSKLLTGLTEKYDGSTMAGLDALIPGPEKYVGKVRPPSAIN